MSQRRDRPGRSLRFEWRVPRPRRPHPFGRGQIRRPGNWAQLARPLGLTALVLAYIAVLEEQWLYAVLMGLGGIGGILVWAGDQDRPGYMPTFPYEFIGDLDEQPPTARIGRGQRALFALTVATTVLVTWVLFAWSLKGLAIGAVPALLCFIWGYETTQWPQRWQVRIACYIALAVALPIGGLGLLLAPRVAEALTGALVAGVTVGALVLIGLTLHQVSRRTPDRLL